MTVTVKHAKTNAISDWTQAQLDEQIALGNFAPGTTLANIVLPSDWNNDHTFTGTLDVSNGGTGASTLTGYVKGNGTLALTASATIPNTDISGLGTISTQNANNVAITGGTIDNASIGATTASTGKFTSVTTPSVTASSTDLTLSSVGTNNINLTSGNGTQLKVNDTYGAGGTSVNYFSVYGRQTGSSPILATEGADSVISPIFAAKGGSFTFRTTSIVGGTQFLISHTASAVNYVQVTGSSTGAAASSLGGISFTGSDASPNFAIGTKGTGYIAFYGGATTNVQAFRINTTNAANTGNLLQVQGAASGSAPSISAISGTSGTDANIDITLTPKGTGVLRFGTLTATADTAISGYITIKDSGGTTRKLAVIT